MSTFRVYVFVYTNKQLLKTKKLMMYIAGTLLHSWCSSNNVMEWRRPIELLCLHTCSQGTTVRVETWDISCLFKWKHLNHGKPPHDDCFTACSLCICSRYCDMWFHSVTGSWDVCKQPSRPLVPWPQGHLSQIRQFLRFNGTRRGFYSHLIHLETYCP